MRADLSIWRPTLSEFTLPFKQARPWELSLQGFSKGIDNAHVDVFLSPRLRERLRETVRMLIVEDVSTLSRRAPEQLVSTQDLDSFRESYVGLFEATLQHTHKTAPSEMLALLQLSLLKCLLEVVAGEIRRLQNEFKSADLEETHPPGNKLDLHDSLVAINREEHAIYRRVLHLLLRQVRKLEGGHLAKLRASLAGEEWPLPEQAIFNPVLLTPLLGHRSALAADYPIAGLSEGGHTRWLSQTNQCICTVFQYYLPPWTRLPAARSVRDTTGGINQERHDQGLLQGFLEVEMLLSRFVSQEEYGHGRVSWLDEPQNLRLFLSTEGRPKRPGRETSRANDPWGEPRWLNFRRAVKAELFHCLDIYGLSKRVTLLHQYASIRNQLGKAIPLSLLQDYVEGHLHRRRLNQRVESLHLGLDPSTVARELERSATELKHLPPSAIDAQLTGYLVDFLRLRRDLKLAYRTYQAMDGIRLIEDTEEVKLSRSNASLQEYPCPDELGPLLVRIRSHVVIKADLRGSTQITEQLRAKGLNPASHFSLNFFDPVNKLLPEFGAEKVFVEGDAVILAIFEHDNEVPGFSVARACGLAQKVLQVVSLQNILNRKHGLPELELGLGIAYTPTEPNFLFDQGHRIMISGAINRADRLSSCSSDLRHCGLAPKEGGLRVAVLREKKSNGRRRHAEDLLSYNVNGVRLEETAFLKLQNEIDFQQVQLPGSDGDQGLFFSGSYADVAGRNHRLAVRYAPVREWDGVEPGAVDPNRRHFFEVIVDEKLTARIRKLIHDMVP